MSPENPEYVSIGLVTAPVGLEGEIKVNPATDFTEERFRRGATVYVNGVPYTVARATRRRAQFVLKLDGIDGVAQAEELRGQLLEIHRDQLKPPEDGGYYHFQLEGLEVRTVEGKVLGVITRILPTGSNDNFLVRDGAGHEVLIPAIDEVVKTVDLERGRVVIEPMPGLLELND